MTFINDFDHYPYHVICVDFYLFGEYSHTMSFFIPFCAYFHFTSFVTFFVRRLDTLISLYDFIPRCWFYFTLSVSPLPIIPTNNAIMHVSRPYLILFLLTICSMCFGLHFLSEVSPNHTLPSSYLEPENPPWETGKIRSLWNSCTKTWSKCLFFFNIFPLNLMQIKYDTFGYGINDSAYIYSNVIH